jgi:hypothetical protein
MRFVQAIIDYATAALVSAARALHGGRADAVDEDGLSLDWSAESDIRRYPHVTRRPAHGGKMDYG